MAESRQIMIQLSQPGAEHMNVNLFTKQEARLQSVLDKESATNIFSESDVQSGKDDGVTALLSVQNMKGKVAVAKKVMSQKNIFAIIWHFDDKGFEGVLLV